MADNFDNFMHFPPRKRKACDESGGLIILYIYIYSNLTSVKLFHTWALWAMVMMGYKKIGLGPIPTTDMNIMLLVVHQMKHTAMHCSSAECWCTDDILMRYYDFTSPVVCIGNLLMILLAALDWLLQSAVTDQFCVSEPRETLFGIVCATGHV